MNNPSPSSLSILVASVVALAAIVSAIATVVMVRLTSRLAKATENYASLMHEELSLLRAQMEVPMLVGIRWNSASSPALGVICEHPGSPNSLPVIIKKAVLEFNPEVDKQSAKVTDEHSFNEFLKPGKTWRGQVAPKISTNILKSPRPNLLKVLFSAGQKKILVGNLTLSLHYERAQKLEVTSREYEVHTDVWKDVVLMKVAN